MPTYMLTWLRRTVLSVLALLLVSALGPAASAQDLIYTPQNPAFGGSPLNYQWLVNSAQLQNAFEEDSDPFDQDPFADFERDLQRQILRELSREIIGERFGELDFDEGGQFDLGDFIVEVTPGLDGIQIRIFNTLTGDESVISVPNP